MSDLPPSGSVVCSLPLMYVSRKIVGVGPLTISSFDASMSATRRPSGQQHHLLIDLRRTTFVDPYALVGMACALQNAGRSPTEIEFLAPESSREVRNYLSRARFGSMLEATGVWQHGLPEVNENDVTGKMLELEHFDDEGGPNQLGRMVWIALYEHQQVKQGLADRVSGAVWEAADNVMTHSAEAGSYASGFVAAQLYRPGYRDPYLVFAVGDAGRGVRKALQTVMSVADDRHGLELALTKGVTSSDDARGKGLPSIVKRIGESGGTVTLRSGMATCRVRRGRSPHYSDVGHLPGTIVAGSIECGGSLWGDGTEDGSW